MTKPNVSIKEQIDNLSCDALETKPINIDWREMLGEDAEGWKSFEANECQDCGGLVVLNAGQGEEPHKDLFPFNEYPVCPTCGSTDNSEMENGTTNVLCGECGREFSDPRQCEGHVSIAEGPMMNYWYPVKIDNCEEAARKLANLPLCVVEFRDGETGLALTGGGMNLSWEICEAFIAISYLPPFHFCDLPAMAGLTLDDKHKLIIEACRKSCEVIGNWAKSRAERLENTVKSIKKDDRERKQSKKK